MRTQNGVTDINIFWYIWLQLSHFKCPRIIMARGPGYDLRGYGGYGA